MQTGQFRKFYDVYLCNKMNLMTMPDDVLPYKASRTGGGELGLQGGNEVGGWGVGGVCGGVLGGGGVRFLLPKSPLVSF